MVYGKENEIEFLPLVCVWENSKRNVYGGSPIAIKVSIGKLYNMRIPCIEFTGYNIFLKYI